MTTNSQRTCGTIPWSHSEQVRSEHGYPLVRRIPAHQLDAERSLTKALSRALERLGARVVIDAGGENLVRARGPSCEITWDPLQASGAVGAVEVHAQGLPNLLHEVVHIALSARLDNDHGIDYQAIPFDLDTKEGRAILWEELCCCVVSCSYLSRAGCERQVDDWFAEQLDIQPVFYGLEGRFDVFLGRVASALAEFRETFEGTLDRAYRRVEALLRFGGADDAVAEPPCRLGIDELFGRQGWGAGHTAER